MNTSVLSNTTPTRIPSGLLTFDESTDQLTETENRTSQSYNNLQSFAQEEFDTTQWPLILLFRDRALEKEFTDYYYVRYADKWWKRYLQLRLSLFFLTFGMEWH